MRRPTRQPPLAAARFLWSSSSSSLSLYGVCRVFLLAPQDFHALGLMRCFCSASSWVLHLVGLVSTSPWLRGVDQFGGGIIACAHLCVQGWALFFGLLSALSGGYFYHCLGSMGRPYSADRAMGIGSVRGLLLSSERLFGEGAPSCFSRSGLDFVLAVVHSLPLRSCGGVIAGFVEPANGESLAWRFVVASAVWCPGPGHLAWHRAEWVGLLGLGCHLGWHPVSRSTPLPTSPCVGCGIAPAHRLRGAPVGSMPL